MTINYGDLIVISDGKGKRWLIKLKKNGILHTHYGIIKHDEIIGKESGEYIETHLGKKLWILNPTLDDLVLKISRKTQIVYPKDIGLMIVLSGVSSGSKVLEVGTGSGALTTALAYTVRPDGIVDTYEKRRDFYELAVKNLERYGLDKYVNFHYQDFLDAEIKDNFYDAAFIDIDSPWLILEKIWRGLRGGAPAFFIIPTYSQLDKIASSIHKYFIEVSGIETVTRNILIRPGRIRPPFQMIGYTAVIVWGKKKLTSTDEE